MARAGYVAQSPLFRLYVPFRPGAIPRIPVVLLHERTGVAVPESALSARLQHGAPPIFLAISPDLVVSLERVFPGSGEAFLQAGRSRRPHAFAGALLGGLRPGFLHVFDDAGILLDALLSGARSASRLGHGNRRRLDSARHSRPLRYLCLRGHRRLCDSHSRAGHPDARRHFLGSDSSSKGLLAFPRPHGRPDLGIVCVSSLAARDCWRRLSNWRVWNSSRNRPASISRGSFYDGLDGRVCWRSAGSASSWFSSRFRQRRNTTRCPAIRRSLCF